MGTGLGAQIGLDEDDDIERYANSLWRSCAWYRRVWMCPFTVVSLRYWPGQVVVIHLAAIFAMWPPPGIETDVGEVERGIAPQLGNQVQVALPRHLQGIVITEVPVQHHGGQRDYPSDQLP